MIARRTAILKFGVVLLWIIPYCCFSQDYIGLREIVNYEKQHYNAGAQNWDIRQDAEGRMYFANNEGLLCFDGTYWKLYPLDNKTIVRSLEFGSDHRIYIGAQDEIGYFTPDASGRLFYTSLKPLLPEADRTFADIWESVSFQGSIFFRSNNKIFRYAGNKIEVLKAPASWLFMGLHDKQLLAQDQREGLLTFKDGHWTVLVPKVSLPPGFDITEVTTLSPDSCLVATQSNGLYILSGNKLSPFVLSGMPIDVSQYFSESVKIDEDHFIAGTYTHGFYLIDRNGVVIENFSKKEGLQNSNIRSLFVDRHQNIWLGLESGIDFIAFNNAIKHINPPVMNDGAGYAVAILRNSLFFGLSNGIYELPLPAIRDLSYAKSDFRMVTGGQTWGLSVVNDRLLAGRDEGFFEVHNHGVTPVQTNTGYWTFQSLRRFNNQSSLVVAGNYDGVRLFEVNGNQYVDKGAVEGFHEPSRFLVIDNNDVVWVSHPYRGIYKIRYSGQSSTVKLYTASNGLPSSLKNHVYKVKDRVVIATEKGVYEYNGQKDMFEPSAYYREIFGNRSVRYLKEDAAGNIWFIQDKVIGVVDFSTLKPGIIYLPELKGKVLSGFEHIYPVDDENVFVGGEKGFYHINYAKYRRNNHPLHVYVSTVRTIGKKDSVFFGGYFGNVNEAGEQLKGQAPAVDHQWNSFHIEFSAPLYEQQSNIEYSYFLSGFDNEWSDWGKKTEKDYTNLPAGSYTFQVKARNNLRNESAISSYSFSVRPPWYQTGWAYGGYVLLGGLLAWLLYRRQQQKLMQIRLKHAEEQKRIAYLHQLELEKSEKEVVKLRNENLEREIGFKNSELITTAMHLVQKEEFLQKIKGELQHLNKNGKEKQDQGELKKLLRVLSEEEKLDEEWEQFAVHFDKVHGDFLIKLKEKYPDLKPHELKLCAYLRMNLSSKEIARLMSISVRGVEISRYRLRKKMQLATETNLFQFLFDLERNGFV